METKKRNIPLLVVLALILAAIPYARLVFGADFTDTGYSIVNFTNFLDERAYWSLQTYGANALGRLFMLLPGGSTFIGLRAYCTFVVSALNLLLFFELIKEYHIFPVFVGLLISNFMAWCPYVVLYNYLSYFLIAATVLLLVSGLKHGVRGRLLCAGVILGVSVFVRFSNITMIILILPVLYYDFLCVKRFASVLKDVAYCVLGFFIGLGTVYMITVMTHNEHAFPMMIDSLRALSNANYGYALTDMMLALPAAFFDNLKWMIAIGAVTIISIALSHVDASRREIHAVTTFLSLFLVVFMLYTLRRMSYWSVFTVHDYTDYNSVSVFVLLAVLLCLVFSIIDLWSATANYMHKFIALTVVCLIFVIPIGTNTGMLAYQNALFLIYPISLGIAWDKMIARTSFRISKFGLKHDTQNYLGRIGIAIVIVTMTLIQSALFFANFSYGSAGTKELTATLTKAPLKGARVLPGMVGIIEGLEEYYEEAGLEGSETITWGDIPLMAYALGSKTALSTGWPDLKSFPEESFEEEIGNLDTKPVIIVNKWYSGGDPLDPEAWKYSGKAEILAGYMEDNNYTLTYENDKFKVYLAE